MEWYQVVSVALPAFVSLISLIGRILLGQAEHPSERYEDKVQKLRKDRWGEVSAALGELIVQVQETAEESDEQEINDQPTEEAMFALIIQKKYNSDMLTDVEEELEEYEEPLDLFQTCRRSVDKISTFLFAAIILGIISVLVALAPILLDRYEIAALATASLFSGASLCIFGMGCYYWIKWRNSREGLDRIWEQYAFIKEI